MSSISFSLQAALLDGKSWLRLAWKAERLGFETLYVADHPGLAPSPFVALAAAGAGTETIRLGTYVANAGLRHPLDLAIDVATLDQASGGRAVLGLGAGHTPSEWLARGLSYPTASERVERLIDVAELVRRLLDGEEVSFEGAGLSMRKFQLQWPRPVGSVPLVIGGNNPRLLSYGAQHADVVSFTGLGRTLEDGHRHKVLWDQASIDQRIGLIKTAAFEAGRTPRIEVLVQNLDITDDPLSAEKRVSKISGADPSDLLASPFVLIGSPEQIADEIIRHAQRWSITSYVIRESAMAAAAEVMALLN